VARRIAPASGSGRYYQGRSDQESVPEARWGRRLLSSLSARHSKTKSRDAGSTVDNM